MIQVPVVTRNPRQDFVTKNYRSRPLLQRPPPRRVADVTREQAESRDKAGGSEYIRVRLQWTHPDGASPPPRQGKAIAKAQQGPQRPLTRPSEAERGQRGPSTPVRPSGALEAVSGLVRPWVLVPPWSRVPWTRLRLPPG